MNVLEAYQTQRWRTVAFNCWTAAGGNINQAFESFSGKKPAMMPDWAWEAIKIVIWALMQYWITNPPQAVMTSGEAAFLGMDSD